MNIQDIIDLAEQANCQACDLIIKPTKIGKADLVCTCTYHTPVGQNLSEYDCEYFAKVSPKNIRELCKKFLKFIWQDISTAPNDGTVILTNEGSAKFVKNKSPKYTGWYLCDKQGDIPKCADEGYHISQIYPQLWMPFPTSEE